MNQYIQKGEHHFPKATFHSPSHFSACAGTFPKKKRSGDEKKSIMYT
jgi:hypothetical protein